MPVARAESQRLRASRHDSPTRVGISKVRADNGSHGDDARGAVRPDRRPVQVDSRVNKATHVRSGASDLGRGLHTLLYPNEAVRAHPRGGTVVARVRSTFLSIVRA